MSVTKTSADKAIAECPVGGLSSAERLDWIDKYSLAEKLCHDYPTILTRMGKPHPDFKGRENEVAAVSQSLLKRRMRSCVLVGLPGVGKTEIAKKAISMIQTEDLFLSMDLASMISGCTLVGMFEERFTGITGQIIKANKRGHARISLYIDEIHNLFRVGKSDAYGTMSGGEILKPALADGSITIIGATTYDEYNKYIMADKALLRRLPPIFVGGMDDKQTCKIVASFAKKEMNAKLVAYCVGKSHEIAYLNNPDCALEIADRAIARATSENRIVEQKDIDAVISFMKEESHA